MGRKETRRVERRRGSRRCGLLVLIGYNLVFLSGFTPCHSYSDSFFILFTICNMFGYIEIAAEICIQNKWLSYQLGPSMKPFWPFIRSVSYPIRRVYIKFYFH
jgi:hypothetical protein